MLILYYCNNKLQNAKVIYYKKKKCKSEIRNLMLKKFINDWIIYVISSKHCILNDYHPLFVSSQTTALEKSFTNI